MIFIGIDIGGTFIKFTAINAKKEILKSTQIPTNTKLTAADFIEQLAQKVKEIQQQLKAKAVIIGLGIAGDTDDKEGVLHFAPNIRKCLMMKRQYNGFQMTQTLFHLL